MEDTILRICDFTTEARIAGLHEDDTANPANQSMLQWVEEYCQRYEDEFCEKFFSDRQDFEAIRQYAYDGREDDDDMNRKLRMLRFSLSRFVAFHINRVQVNSPIGTIVLDSENGHRTDNRYLQCKLWNDMVDSNIRLFSIMYPSVPVPQHCFGLFSKTNIYGI